jgi:16S rRNA processing protein RimM
LTLLEIGRIVKPHGLRGQVIVELVTNRVERLAPGAALATDGGPLHVISSAPHQGRFLVSFSGVTTRDGADALRGTVLRAEPLVERDAMWIHELIGSVVALPSGEIVGTVDAVQANPASDLLVLDGGQLVPLRFVVEQGAGRVVIDPPPGLLEI